MQPQCTLNDALAPTAGGFFDVLVPIPLTSATSSCWSLLAVACTVIVLLLASHPAAGRELRRASGRSTGQGQSMVSRTAQTAPADSMGVIAMPEQQRSAANGAATTPSRLEPGLFTCEITPATKPL